MKVRFLSILCLLIFLVACNGNNLFNSRPSDVLPGEQMIPLLVDIHLADAALKLNHVGQNPGNVNLYYSTSFAPVFKKHKTTPAVFEKSMNWYSRNIDNLDEIYAEVITRLSTLESQIRIKVKPIRSKSGLYYIIYPETDTTYLPGTPEKLKIPFALPLK